ncbi:hypothetical protein ABIE66_003745 [Peribacillus sp. B2I2]|uniref:P-loop NTPase fold protein n=1 Tax=Peribacillus sp. B2I2 TaxID=3156468 RepID=UPI0035120FAE
MKANEIVTVLNHFNWSKYRRVLIDGTWGIGKTRYVSEFEKDQSHVSYVSLFGKKDIDSIIQEIYFQIIEKAPLGMYKKSYRVLREKFKNVTFRYQGFTISVPLIEDLHKSLNKELGSKGTYIIIFDDLERKHHNLKITEILGLLDSLSKIENIKTVLIAATDQLKGKDKTTFIDYKEKSIDRTYKIDDYADNAPVDILGKQIWEVIGETAKNFDFKNLRTFEKTYMFIKEVIQILGKDIFTDKFTRDDLYRMCFASVFFNIEHKNEMRLLDTEKKDSDLRNADLRNAVYKGSDSGVIAYLYEYILKKNMDNVMSKNVFHHIKNWYVTGTYSRDDILSVIASINSFEEKPGNFYSSEKEILKMIEHTKAYILHLNGTEKVDDIINHLSIAFFWCEALSVDFGMSNEGVLKNIKGNVSNRIELEKSQYQNEVDIFFHSESKKVGELTRAINDTIKMEYQKQLIQKIKDCYIEKTYQVRYLRELTDLVNSIYDQSNRTYILRSLNEHQYFFPIPSGNINENFWFWCIQIKLLVSAIEARWGVENYSNDFKEYLFKLDEIEEDRLLKYRLKTLFER